MKMLPFIGYMIPGLYLETDICIWFLNWSKIPMNIKQLKEVWIIFPDNKRVCYIDPKDGIKILNTYHSFDEVIDCEIIVVEKNSYFKITVIKNNIQILTIELETQISEETRNFNLLLSSEKNEQFFSKGKTETGKIYSNEPQKIIDIKEAKVLLDGKNLGKLIKPRKKIKFGDGETSENPIINYCIHNLEV